MNILMSNGKTLNAYSDTWWVVYGEIEAENDGQLTPEASGLPSVISQNNKARGSAR
ncbi:hypothetical protein [Bradyrhizobium sp. DOA1]|uniref:hypothetical protein n=1 Tax=Bradyrhizobium sp. DOA1 TaxID=1126616 RepID=UPI000AEF13D5|nr:hypothetical protein [Bradyrhizobium sp. DOA1]